MSCPDINFHYNSIIHIPGLRTEVVCIEHDIYVEKHKCSSDTITHQRKSLSGSKASVLDSMFVYHHLNVPN